MKYQKCAIKLWESGGEVIAGTAILANGAVFFTVSLGYELLMSRVINGPVLLRNEQGKIIGKVTLGEDPVTWFGNLPRMYHGSYMWAEMMKDEGNISIRELEQLYDEIDAEIRKSGLPAEGELWTEIEDLNRTASSEGTEK